MEEIEGLREEEVRVDKHDLDLVQETRLRDGVEDNAVPGDQRRREERVLLLLIRKRYIGAQFFVDK